MNRLERPLRHVERAALALFCAGAIWAPGEARAQSSVEKLQAFDLDQVQVTDAYYKNLFSKDVTYMTSTLNPDRLLAPFKAVSQGQDPSTATGLNLYGGWEGASSLLRGHTMGHYLSALAHGYQQAKGSDPALATQIQTRVDYLITQLKSYQDKSAKGYLFGSPEAHFDVIEGKASGSSGSRGTPCTRSSRAWWMSTSWRATRPRSKSRASSVIGRTAEPRAGTLPRARRCSASNTAA